MLTAVLGLFSQDLAVDLGTSNTRVHLRNAGIVADEPTVLAVRTDASGHRTVVAMGAEARPMVGRTPDGLSTVHPIQAGRVDDFEAAEAMLLHLMRRLHGRNGWMRPRVVLAVPWAASEMEVRALRDSCESSGARQVQLVPRPLAAAIGAGLPIHQPNGHLVVDVGGGSTEVSTLAMSGVVSSVSVPGGGVGMDKAVALWLKRHHAILVGERTAERLKIDCGAALPAGAEDRAVAKGRCLRRGIPTSADVRIDELAAAVHEPVKAIAAAITRTLETAPPELASDIVETGVVLTGGGARLARLDEALRRLTGLPVVVAEDPELAVVHGAGRVLEEFDLQQAVAC